MDIDQGMDMGACNGRGVRRWHGHVTNTRVDPPTCHARASLIPPGTRVSCRGVIKARLPARVRSRHGPRARRREGTRWCASTTPTPTWSATPATWRRPRRRVRSSTRASRSCLRWPTR
eukprot:365117-Chlamydomonas_euryale.AAC.1